MACDAVPTRELDPIPRGSISHCAKRNLPFEIIDGEDVEILTFPRQKKTVLKIKWANYDPPMIHETVALLSRVRSIPSVPTIPTELGLQRRVPGAELRSLLLRPSICGVFS